MPPDSGTTGNSPVSPRLLGDDACRERMARKARERAGLFSRERMIADYERLFACVLPDP